MKTNLNFDWKKMVKKGIMSAAKTTVLTGTAVQAVGGGETIESLIVSMVAGVTSSLIRMVLYWVKNK